MNDISVQVETPHICSAPLTPFSFEVARPAAFPVKDFLHATHFNSDIYQQRAGLMNGLDLLTRKDAGGKIDLSDQRFNYRLNTFIKDGANQPFLEKLTNKINSQTPDRQLSEVIKDWAFFKPEVGYYKDQTRAASYRVIDTLFKHYQANPGQLVSDKPFLAGYIKTLFGDQAGTVFTDIVEQMVNAGQIDCGQWQQQIDQLLQGKTATITPAHPVEAVISDLPIAGHQTETRTEALEKPTQPGVNIKRVTVSPPPIAEAVSTTRSPVTEAISPTLTQSAVKEPVISVAEPQSTETIPLYPSAEWFGQLPKMQSFPAGEYEGKETMGLVLGTDTVGKTTARICTIENQPVPYQLYTDRNERVRMRKISPNAPPMAIISGANGWTDEVRADAGFTINPETYFKMGDTMFRLDGNQLVPLPTAKKQAIEEMVRRSRQREADDPRASTAVAERDGLPSHP